MEFEVRAGEGGSGSSDNLAVRRWRDGDSVVNDALLCSHRTELMARLKQVAQWGMRFSSRLHFEWVWDAERLFVVQVDWEEGVHGDVPTAGLVRPANAEDLRLQVFRVAVSGDFDRYKKLANARLYSKIGYQMPAFYILDDENVIGEILKGKVSSELEADLSLLTRTPLIIRVDGAEVPIEKREMLPRSDELRSGVDAARWLESVFAEKIVGANLRDSGVCLIAHHFIPSMASAWARSEPRSRLVRIESVWGVPEGLYWYSHDTFEVDTKSVDIHDLDTNSTKKFRIRRRLRYKGFFVAPNERGDWVTHVTSSTHDWRSSIGKEDWVREIALTTRKISEETGEPTAVMWLVDLGANAAHRVLPWFHNRLDYSAPLQAAPRRKISSNRDFVISSRADWDRLVAMPATSSIDRVRVEPRDADLIRNPDFAQSIAEESKKRGFVVELAGGILSHIYYLLTRQGCRVECIDLYGASDEVIAFQKIVRDLIPEQIERAGESVTAVKLEGEALKSALRKKLVEEAYEVLDAASTDDLRAELADVMEVLDAIVKSEGLAKEEVLREKERKSERRGAFESGYMLVQTTLPHSSGNGQFGGGVSRTFEVIPAVDTVGPGSSPRFEVKPDLRTVRGEVEKLISFNFDLSSIGMQSGVTTFSLPLGHQSVELQLVFELSRHRGEARGAIRLREVPVQLVLDLKV